MTSRPFSHLWSLRRAPPCDQPPYDQQISDQLIILSPTMRSTHQMISPPYDQSTMWAADLSSLDNDMISHNMISPPCWDQRIYFGWCDHLTMTSRPFSQPQALQGEYWYCSENCDTFLDIQANAIAYSYIMFVISFTQAFCAVEILYTQNAWFLTKLNLRQKSQNRSNAWCKIIHCV